MSVVWRVCGRSVQSEPFFSLVAETGPVPKCLHRIDLAAGMLGRDPSNGTLVAPVLLLFLLIFLLAVCIPDPTARDTQSVSGLSWYSWKLLGEGD